MTYQSATAQHSLSSLSGTDSGTGPQKTVQLPTVLSTRDLTVLFVLVVLFISNINGVQFAGPATFFYWVLGFATFLIPSVYVVRWLSLRFPGTGGHYHWTKQILGPQWASVSVFALWLAGVLAVVSTVQGCLIFIRYLLPTWFSTPIEQCLGIILVLVVTMVITCQPLRLLRNILLVLALIYLSVFVLIGIAGAWFLLGGHETSVAFNAPGVWRPDPDSFAVYGIIILALLGIDLPFMLVGEVRGGATAQARSGRFLWWGAGIVALAYLLGTFGIMAIVPANQSGDMTASILAVRMIFGPQAGSVAALMLVAGQCAITITYLLVFSRLTVILAQNNHLPAALTNLNKYGVPVLSIVVQAIIVAAMTIISYVIVPGIFITVTRPSDLAFEIYNVLQAGSTLIWILTMIELFAYPLLLLLSSEGKRVLARSMSANVPGWQRILLLIMGVVGSVVCLVGAWGTISGSWLPSLIPNQRWTILVLVVPLFSLFISWICSEVPRMHGALGELRRINDREIELRNQLQEAYDQQQTLLNEVDRLYREQAQAAITDAITGLPNHRAVISRIEEELALCEQTKSVCGMLFLDIDHFKRINDTWGHRAGDAILREVANRLRAALRVEDFVGRYGGEEFAVILSDTDLVSSLEVAERLRESISSHSCDWLVEETATVVPINITASIGVASYHLHANTREAMIEQADQAMYRAKQTGRNRVCVAGLDVEAPATVPQADCSEMGTLRALNAAALAHDESTGEHAHRLVMFAEETARRLCMPLEETSLVRLGALLHDIGKIGIPDAILHKPGPLTKDEWQVMMRHPQIGQEILSNAGGIFEVLAPIVAAHHERWDGAGYPAQLASQDIPLVARILAVVDSFDAMTTRRVYREPCSVEEACAELLRCSGSQYDPSVVRAFLDVLDTYEHGRSAEASVGGKALSSAL
jgi:diguanylate cyclase (GGDEF)-like protein